MMKKITGFFGRIQYNSPVVLTFMFASFGALILDMALNGAAGVLLFSVYRSSPADPLTYLRLFGHVMGHSGFSHFFNNFLIILLVGPTIEERYGHRPVVLMILATAALTGVAHMIFSAETRLMGASGVVFMMIILSSFVSLERGRIPLTLILCVFVFIGQEVVAGVSQSISDNVTNISYASHIAGGALGAAFGLLLNSDVLFRRKIKP